MTVRKYACESDEIAGHIADLAKERAAIRACTCDTELDPDTGGVKRILPLGGCVTHGGALPAADPCGWRQALAAVWLRVEEPQTWRL